MGTVPRGIQCQGVNCLLLHGCPLLSALCLYTCVVRVLCPSGILTSGSFVQSASTTGTNTGPDSSSKHATKVGSPSMVTR